MRFGTGFGLASPYDLEQVAMPPDQRIWLYDKTARVWIVNMDDYIRLGRARVVRDLNNYQRAQFFLPTLIPTLTPTPLLTVTPLPTLTPSFTPPP
jgi:hypothetical protein